MRQRHLLSLKDYSREELEDVFGLAAQIKAEPRAFKSALEGRSLAMIFLKPSARARAAGEVGMLELGGHAVFLGPDDLQLHRGVTVADTAQILSRLVDAILARVFAHQDILDLAKYGTVPVINGLSDLLHPYQALTDFFTLWERRGSLDGLRLGYVGDGNAVCHELMMGAVKLGVAMVAACPAGHEPSPLIVKSAARDAQKLRVATPEVGNDPWGAVSGADAVYTDVWTPVGLEAEFDARQSAFQGFQVTSEMLAAAAPDAVFMHPLPARRGEEVAAEVIDGSRSIVFDQVENHLHVGKALLVRLLGTEGS